jgi:pantoate--beta-alanine ligase
MMKVIKTIKEMQRIADKLREEGKKIAVVPTMGYLHEGHTSLMKIAREHSDFVITTLFVNPTQFAPHEDFTTYPRNFDRDFRIAEEHGCDILFNPEVDEMYPHGFATSIKINNVTEKFEGEKRPGHFDGVATVVCKLFTATKAHFGVFGQKDVQQTIVIKKLVDDLNLDIKIIVAPTLRQSDGLAMSSRNVYLSVKDRTRSSILYSALTKAKDAIEKGEKRRKIINAIMHAELRTIHSIKLDYAMSADVETLDEPEEYLPGQHIVMMIACFLGKTRLIDNMLATIPSGISEHPEKFEEM